jgi:hypothetical protein
MAVMRRERETEQRGERDRERSVCHGMMVVLLVVVLCFVFLSLYDASESPTFPLACLLSFSTGRLACAQDHAFPQLP